MSDPAPTSDPKATMAAALAPFGWTCTDEFWRRYHSDPWVFNLANAVERQAAGLCAAESARDTAWGEVDGLRADLAAARAVVSGALDWFDCPDGGGSSEIADAMRAWLASVAATPTSEDDE